jgi:fructan beta-fructosidase
MLSCLPPAPKQHRIPRHTTYHEAHRPQYHFTPDSMWMNDPNGMVFFEGEYHLFYQFYPDSNVWGPMHWGHAVSEDLVHWEQLPMALVPDERGYIFSGSAVVDHQHTAGFGQGDHPAMVAIFTYHDPVGEAAGRDDFQTQGIAYSLDRGRTWTKYAGNPVLPNPGIRDFRDPKVFWHEGTSRWVMILAVKDRVHLYTSPNLKQWTLASEFGAALGAHGGVWECPDLFALDVEGQPGEQCWVMLVSIGDGGPNGGSATQYFIGDFDGERFVLDSAVESVQWLDWGKDNYAGVTWSNVPEADGRRLLIGWMSNWQYATVVPTYRWRSAMTLPRTLTLRQTPAGIRLYSAPVAEVARLRKPPLSMEGHLMAEELRLDGIHSGSTELSLVMTWDSTAIPTELGLRLYNEAGEELFLGVLPQQEELYVDRRTAGPSDFSPQFAGRHTAVHSPQGQRIALQVFVDRSSIEVFADGGRTVMTELVFPHQPFTHYELFTEGAPVEVASAKAWPLKSIWIKK